MNFLKTNHGPLLVFFAAILWASDAPFRVHLSQNLPSDLIVLCEHVIVLAVIGPLLFKSFTSVTQLTVKEWCAVCVVGVGGSALALILFTESFNYMNPSVVILLQKMQPLIAIALAVVILKEVTPLKFWKWALLGIGGAYVITFPNLVPQLYAGDQLNPHIIGVCLALGAAALWAASTVLGRYLLSTVSYSTMTVLRFLTASVFLIVYTMLSGSFAQVVNITEKEWFYLVIISVISGVVAMTVYYMGLAKSKASIATIAELGFPLAAVVVNYVFLDAALSPIQLLGMAGVVWAVIGLSRLNQRG